MRASIDTLGIPQARATLPPPSIASSSVQSKTRRAEVVGLFLRLRVRRQCACQANCYKTKIRLVYVSHGRRGVLKRTDGGRGGSRVSMRHKACFVQYLRDAQAAPCDRWRWKGSAHLGNAESVNASACITLMLSASTAPAARRAMETPSSQGQCWVRSPQFSESKETYILS